MSAPLEGLAADAATAEHLALIDDILRAAGIEPEPTHDVDAIEHGGFAFMSKSQLETFEACPRKGGLQYIANLQRASGSYAALGTEIEDEQLVPYLTEGRPFDFSRPSRSGYKAAALLPYLPAPRTPGMVLQQRVELPGTKRGSAVAGAYGYQGWIDLWLPDSRLMPPAAAEHIGLPRDGMPVVIDFKSTTNLDYAKTAKKLATDDQGQSYATWALRATGAPWVHLAWLTTRTRGAEKAKHAYLKVTPEHAARHYAAIDERAARTVQLRRKTPRTMEGAMSLAPNWDHCRAYGGCSFEHICNKGPGEAADAYAAEDERKRALRLNRNQPDGDETTTMTQPAPTPASLFAALAGSAPPAAPPPVQPAPVVAPMLPPPMPVAPQPGPALPHGLGLYQPQPGPAPIVAAINAGVALAPPEGVPVLPMQGAPTVPGQVGITPGGTPVVPAQSINPPEAYTLPPAPLQGAAAPITPEQAAAIQAQLAGGAPAPVAQVETIPAPAATVTAPRGRPRKADAAPAATVNAQQGALQRAVWGKEVYWPERSIGCEIGPFELSDYPTEGESAEACLTRLKGSLKAMAEAARAEKLASCAAQAQANGGSRS